MRRALEAIALLSFRGLVSRSLQKVRDDRVHDEEDEIVMTVSRGGL